MLIKPRKLEQGATIGLIAPAGPFTKDTFDKGVAFLEGLGFQVRYREDIFRKTAYLAGDDETRAKEIQWAIQEEEISAILPVRGGYGLMRILDKLDYERIRETRKIWLGFSDLTALHLAINKFSSLITFHSPNLSTLPLLPPTMLPQWQALLMDEAFNNFLFEQRGKALRSGRAKGKLIPANLALLTSLAGSRYFPAVDGAILALEDIAEPAYRVDRMLTQLALNGVFEKVSALVTGQFSLNGEGANAQIALIETRLQELSELYDFPLLCNAPFGHEAENINLPIGVEVELDTEARRLRLLESVVE